MQCSEQLVDCVEALVISAIQSNGRGLKTGKSLSTIPIMDNPGTADAQGRY
jgi:hypothetical protein